MFLENNKDFQKINKLQRESCTYNAYYSYWIEQLFERIMRLFVWENTYDVETNTGVKPKEIEQRLLLRGHCGVTKLQGEKELTAMSGTFYGVTKYADEKTHYTVRCPIYSGKREINKNIVVIDNNAIRNHSFALVHHYATLLAHTEVSYIDAIINLRDNDGVPIAQTEKQKQSIIEYQSKRFNGQYGVVTDLGALGIEYAGVTKGINQDIKSLYETRNKILKDFYADCGIRSAYEKRSNTVQAEVESDTSLLLLNLSDMLDARKKGCEKVNALYGVNWSVHIAKEIDYGTENEDKTQEVAENV